MMRREDVCIGAWGMRPFGAGTPIKPAMKVVIPRRKKS